MQNTNTTNNNTQPTTQQDEKKLIDRFRQVLDKIKIDNVDDIKKRKKLKRWFDRCRKKNINDQNTEEGNFCYIIHNNELFMGKKGKNNMLDPPCLSISSNDVYINPSSNSNININTLNYDDFNKLYYEPTVGNGKFCSFFENLYDGFMSYTQYPGYMFVYDDDIRSKRRHAINIGTRILSPVIAAGVGVCAGAAAAFAGAKALKDKIIPTEEERKAMENSDKAYLYYTYTNTNNKDLNDLQEGLIDDWKSGKMRDMSYNQLMRVLDSNREIYRNPHNNIYRNQPNKDLNAINNENNIAH